MGCVREALAYSEQVNMSWGDAKRLRLWIWIGLKVRSIDVGKIAQ